MNLRETLKFLRSHLRRKVRVCFLSYYGYKLFNEKSSRTFGGVEVLFYLMGKALSTDRRFDIHFIVEDDIKTSGTPDQEAYGNITLHKTSRSAPGPAQESHKDVREVQELYRDAMRVFPNLAQLPHIDFFRLWNIFKNINADIYIQGGANYETGLVATLCKIMNKKFVYLVAHDVDVNKTYAEKNGVLGSIFEYGLSRADRICCLSPDHQTQLKANYGRTSILIPHWFPVTTEVSPLEKRDYILWVARVEEWKHPEIFLTLAEAFPEEKFIVIGAFSEQAAHFFREIEERVKRLSNVQIIPGLPFWETNKYFAHAKVFIETADYGRLVTTHLQAATVGTPCLTFFKDPDETFKEYRWGHSARGNTEALQKLLKNLLSDKREWAQLSERARIYAQTRHTIERNAKEFKKMLFGLRS